MRAGGQHPASHYVKCLLCMHICDACIYAMLDAKVVAKKTVAKKAPAQKRYMYIYYCRSLHGSTLGCTGTTATLLPPIR